MKQIPILLFIAAIAAFIVLPVSFSVAVSVLFGAAFLGITVSDYSRLARAQARVRACQRPAPRLSGQAAIPSRR